MFQLRFVKISLRFSYSFKVHFWCYNDEQFWDLVKNSRSNTFHLFDSTPYNCFQLVDGSNLVLTETSSGKDHAERAILVREGGTG